MGLLLFIALSAALPAPSAWRLHPVMAHSATSALTVATEQARALFVDRGFIACPPD
jgi:hypothetical protein